MLNYQCHCQVMQEAWLRAICGFCGFFSVSECLRWLPMAIVSDLNPPQWIPPSPIFSFIAGVKERRDSQRLWALLSYQILLMTLGKRHSLLYLHDSEIQSSVKCRVFQWKIFKFLSGSCVRSGTARVYFVLLPAHKFIESSLWTPGKAQQCIKTKHPSFSAHTQGAPLLQQDWVQGNFWCHRRSWPAQPQRRLSSELQKCFLSMSSEQFFYLCIFYRQTNPSLQYLPLDLVSFPRPCSLPLLQKFEALRWWAAAIWKSNVLTTLQVDY